MGRGKRMKRGKRMEGGGGDGGGKERVEKAGEGMKKRMKETK